MAPTKVFTLEEVAKHKTEKDLWLIIDGKVYDVTAFVDEHPGGVNTLTDNAGTDGSGEFDAVGHSAAAKDMLKKYLIGELSEEDKAKAPAKRSSHAAGTQSNNSAIAFVIVLMAIVLYLIVKQ